MKKIIGFVALITALSINAQDNQLVSHYEAFYKQMKIQGDTEGVVNALTHLNILAPNQARKDTLAAYYMNNGKHLQALNVLGVEVNASDSDLAVEIKGVSLQTLNQFERAIPHYEEFFKRKPNVLLAYELADLKLQTKDFSGAKTHVNYGLANAKDDEKRSYYENRQQPYQVSTKAAFTYLSGLLKFSENQKVNLDAAIALFTEALSIAPNFNLAKISRDALEVQKSQSGTKN